MMGYYSAVIGMCLLALCALCVLISENHRLSGRDKRLLFLTYALITLSALAEWCGVRLDGQADLPRWVLRAVKCADYTLTPMAGGALVIQMGVRRHRRAVLLGVLLANTLLQLAGAFTGWTVEIDARGRYGHGPLYPLYMGVCGAILILVIVEFIIYGKGFRRQNRKSLYAIMFLTVAGIVGQETLPSNPRIAYLGLTVGAALMYIHYSEFSSMRLDESLAAKQVQLETDALTGVFNRYAFNRALRDFDASEPLPKDLAAFTIDINGLKQTNDSLGHEAGDELIVGAARCIEGILGDVGRCFRTGGDEFVVLASMTWDEAEQALNRLRRDAARWQGRKVKAMSLAAGYALAKDHAGVSAEKLVREADMAMYAAKAAFYREVGEDRRRQRG